MKTSHYRNIALLVLALGVSHCARAQRAPNAARARERWVSGPSSIAQVSSAHRADGMNDEIRFGGPLGRSALYLKFPSEWRTHGSVVQAFLVLSPREASPSSDIPLPLEAWRISANWQPQTLQRWSDKPSLAPPYARMTATASPSRELRIDVTDLLRFAAQNPERDFGIAVVGSGSEGPAQSFSSGLGGGKAPRLELYLR